ncbi:MAG: hypothetical protein IT371_09745 [Deltaproteobacteria bacterium]|nr:hypothetical protein [Deltaproteobacteria bacterium]
MSSSSRDIVLLCNPQAGGHWKALAEILDSEEAQHARRIVTDSIDDLGPALEELGKRTELVCIYGGDGTIQRVLDRVCRQARARRPRFAFIGGGTMNVVARWCGLSDTPAQNFRSVVRAHRAGQLLFKSVPLLAVRHGAELHHGFTFGSGPLVRLLSQFEKSSKSLVQVANTAVRSLSAVWSKRPADYAALVEPMQARVQIDGETLPADRFTLVFCNTTGRLFVGTDPFVEPRTRDTFHVAAYAITPREFSLMMPLLARGLLPIDPHALRSPVSAWTQAALSFFGRGQFPTDPRYVNRPASHLELDSPERIFTLDGEVLESDGEPISVELGPAIELAMSSTVDVVPGIRLAARIARSATDLALGTLRRGM